MTALEALFFLLLFSPGGISAVSIVGGDKARLALPLHHGRHARHTPDGGHIVDLIGYRYHENSYTFLRTSTCILLPTVFGGTLSTPQVNKLQQLQH